MLTSKFCTYCDGYPCVCEPLYTDSPVLDELERSHQVEPPPWKDKAMWTLIAIVAAGVMLMVGSSWL